MSFLSHQFPDSRQNHSVQDRRVISAIDSRFPNCDVLIQSIVPTTRVIVIGSQAKAIAEITHIMMNSACQEIFFIGQGSPGCLKLGNDELSLNTLIQYHDELQSWFPRSVEPQAQLPRLNFLGSNVAAGDGGKEFLARLQSITGAEISASQEVTHSKIFQG